jgi:hypothetical protein
MEQQFNELKKIAEPYRGTLVIDMASMRVVRLVGVSVDGYDDEYCWVYEYEDKRYSVSCALGWSPLKGVIPKDDYDWMKGVWNNNNLDWVE